MSTATLFEPRQVWRELFMQWPSTLPKRGIVVTALNVETPFKSFLLRGEMLLLERTNPDAVGARFILLGFDAIHIVKLIDPLKETVFTGAGFVGQFAKV